MGTNTPVNDSDGCNHRIGYEAVDSGHGERPVGEQICLNCRQTLQSLINQELQRERDRLLAALPSKDTPESYAKGSASENQAKGWNQAIDQVTKAINNKEGNTE